MLERLNPIDHPGALFVFATLLPLASFALLLVAGGIRSFLRSQRTEGGASDALYQMLGGDATGRGSAWVATGAIMLSCVLCVIGCIRFLGEHHAMHAEVEAHEKKLQQLESAALAKKAEQAQQKQKKQAAAAKEEKEPAHDDHADPEVAKLQKTIHELHDTIHELEGDFENRWSDRIEWAWLSYRFAERKALPSGVKDQTHGTALELGYRIDHLAAIMFVMVSFIASLIHLFSIGYMSDELQKQVEDHEVHTEGGHLVRRGRFGRFFLYLSLFCFSMLNLVLADNLFQVFLSWELVGICSFLLIGHYYERTSASNASNKAFITNRIGDAGFIIGMLILWTSLGTFNFQEIFGRLRAPVEAEAHGHVGHVPVANRIVRGELVDGAKPGKKHFQFDANGSEVLIFARQPHFHAEDLKPTDQEGKARLLEVHERPVEIAVRPTARQFSSLPYWMLVVAGLGIFLGCVGKSAQFPLQVWLPDAMEGPTPVSALIHAATMVAAGVYLVGRAYPLFTPEVLLTIAYVGGITLFVAATIAVVMTDIKKVLAYSTVSQLGYMMLGLGVGGWAAGLFHLITHAFFKALMFLASGSVIYGCHHEQNMLKMGGLYPKMKITAVTMLMGVLAIAGIPLFSGWYSKDAILASALGFGLAHKQHLLLFILPLATAGITTFYMFRMWFMTFTGKPRDEHVHEHAHESPWIMTVPLILLAVFSVCVAWPVAHVDSDHEVHYFPLLNAEASWLEHQIHHAQPGSVRTDFGGHAHSPYELAHSNHDLAGLMALGIVALGLAFALIVYYWRLLDPEDAREQFPGLHRFLVNKWRFDELYSAILVRPALVIAGWCRNFDLKVIDGVIHSVARWGVRTARGSGRFDLGIIDGLANLVANVSWSIGNWLRNIQTGYLRSYILFLALAAVGIWIILTALLGAASGGGP